MVYPAFFFSHTEMRGFSMAKNFYGFRYTDGTNTTTTTGSDYRIAGTLFVFRSRESRDRWVANGYPYRVSVRDGEFRRAIAVRDLPAGWRVTDAVCVDYPLCDCTGDCR